MRWVSGLHAPREGAKALDLLQDVITVSHYLAASRSEALHADGRSRNDSRLVDTRRLLRGRQLLLHQIAGQDAYPFTSTTSRPPSGVQIPSRIGRL